MIFTRTIGLLSVLFALNACTFSFDWYWRAKAARALARNDFASALSTYKKIIDNNPDGAQALEAARLGAKVAHLDAKNYALAVEFYRLIVLRSPDSEERRTAQRYIAQIHFENLQDYDQAIVEYEKLLQLGGDDAEDFHFRLNLAKSQLHLNNIEQALNEIDVLLGKSRNPDQRFEAEVLKANTLVADKRISEATQLWETILADFPEKSKKENVGLNLVVCYEELKEFSKAIDLLERMREGYPHPDFLNLRIQRLKERQANLPGAKGLKK